MSEGTNYTRNVKIQNGKSEPLKSLILQIKGDVQLDKGSHFVTGQLLQQCKQCICKCNFKNSKESKDVSKRKIKD